MIIEGKENIKAEDYLKVRSLKDGEVFIFLNDEIPELYMKAANDMIVNLENGYVEDIEYDEDINITPVKIINCELVIKE